MKEHYLNNIVDISDPDCLFIKEFDNEIKKYGAVVYNHEYNTYQFIKKFQQIDYKKELLPDFIKLEDSHSLLKAVTMTVHYEFDPETEEDEENLEIWQQLKEIDLPVFTYEDDGEIEYDRSIKLNPEVSKHTIWFLKEESYEYIADIDLLLLDPVIKNLKIAQTLIKDYGVHPCEADYDKDDLKDYQEPDLSAVTRKRVVN